MNENLITVCCKVDEHNRITSVDSSIFIQDLTGWLELDNSDSGSRASRDAYALAQGNYFPDSLTDGTGAHRYLYDAALNPKYREAVPEEMQSERDAMPKPEVIPDPRDLVIAQLMRDVSELKGGVIGV